MKKSKIITVLSAVFIMTAVLSFSVNASLYGDVDNSGDISSQDARAALRFSVCLSELSDDAYASADVDRNGLINASDARCILRASVGMEKFYEGYFRNSKEKFDLKEDSFKKIRYEYNSSHSLKKYEEWEKTEIVYSEEYNYKPDGKIDFIEFCDGKKTEFLYRINENGMLEAEGINPDGSKALYIYGKDGKLTETDGFFEHGNFIKKYDSLGRIKSCENKDTHEKEVYTYMCDTEFIRTVTYSDGSYMYNDYNVDGKLRRSDIYSSSGKLSGYKYVAVTTGNIDMFFFADAEGVVDEERIETLTYDENFNLLADVMSELVEAPDGYDKYLVYEYRWQTEE